MAGKLCLINSVALAASIWCPISQDWWVRWRHTRAGTMWGWHVSCLLQWSVSHSPGVRVTAVSKLSCSSPVVQAPHYSQIKQIYVWFNELDVDGNANAIFCMHDQYNFAHLFAQCHWNCCWRRTLDSLIKQLEFNCAKNVPKWQVNPYNNILRGGSVHKTQEKYNWIHITMHLGSKSVKH